MFLIFFRYFLILYNILKGDFLPVIYFKVQESTKLFKFLVRIEVNLFIDIFLLEILYKMFS